MYKALRIGESWYVYQLSPPDISECIAGPYKSRQAAHQKANRLNKKAAATV